MNIYKTKYCKIKYELKSFGEKIQYVTAKELRTAAFWKKRDMSGTDDAWEKIITKYLAYGNTDEERECIEFMFFRDMSVIEFCRKYYISEGAYYVKYRRIMNDILFMATESGLISTGLVNDETAVVKEITDITDSGWNEIQKLAKSALKRNDEFLKRSVEGILYVRNNGLPWRELPKRYGAWQTLYHKYVRWKKIGLLQSILRLVEADDAE